MKAIMRSIHPEWCELIAERKKNIEVRKSVPAIAGKEPYKVYIYCTVGKAFQPSGRRDYFGNGKVIGEYVVRVVYDITPYDDGFITNRYECGWDAETEHDCLTFDEMNFYLKGEPGYGEGISDLVIYDKPRELSEFSCDGKPITRPPQSFCYVEEVDG